MRSPPSNCPTNESVVVTVLFVPEGLHLGDLFAALASDLVDVLGCGLHHFLHPLLMLLLLSSLKRTKAESFYSSGTTVTVKKERKRPLEDYLFHLHIESKRGHRH